MTLQVTIESVRVQSQSTEYRGKQQKALMYIFFKQGLSQELQTELICQDGPANLFYCLHNLYVTSIIIISALDPTKALQLI